MTDRDHIIVACGSCGNQTHNSGCKSNLYITVIIMVVVVFGRSHLSADGMGVGIEVGLSVALRARSQQGAAHGRQRQCQRLILIVRGHVCDAFTAIAHLVSGAVIEG